MATPAAAPAAEMELPPVHQQQQPQQPQPQQPQPQQPQPQQPQPQQPQPQQPQPQQPQPQQPQAQQDTDISRPPLKIYRLPNYIDPTHNHFKPMELRLGLHTHEKLVTAHGDMDSFKVAVVQKMTQTKAGEDPLGSARWTDFLRAVTLSHAQGSGGSAGGIDAVYETAAPPDPTRIPPGRPQVLALDALFLCVYLCHVSGKSRQLRLVGECREIFGDTEFEARRFPLYRDLMVMGNQLPMSLVLAVMKQLLLIGAADGGGGGDGNVNHHHAGPGPAQDGEEDVEQQRLLGPGGGGGTDEQQQQQEQVEGAAQIMLNEVLIFVAGIVHPFAQGNKLCSRSKWKRKLKNHLDKFHKPRHQRPDGSWIWLPDGLWQCPHILASTYLAICGGHNPLPPKDDTSWWCCRWRSCRTWLHSQLQQQQRQADSDPDPEDLDNVNELPSGSSLKLCGINLRHRWWWSRCCWWCRQQQQGEAGEEDPDPDPEDNVNELPSASSLKLCGIKFKAAEWPYRLDTVAFAGHTLTLPKLVMDDHTASLFRNLALYEQVENSKNSYRSDFRSYLQLMDNLIDSPEDVRVLVRSGVLVNHLGSEEAVSKEWNTMCQGLFLNVSQYRKVQRQIDAHVRAQHYQWFADFRARNCQNPLHALAWVVVCVVTVATVAQTVMAFVAYYLPRG